jgi:hypothetical protein
MARLSRLDTENAQDGWRQAGMRVRFAALANRGEYKQRIAVSDGLFVTPPALADRMIKIADLRGTVLEPSAGSGRIIDAMRRGGYKETIYYHETCPRLREHLRLMGGVACLGDDFLAWNGRADRIVMNPPFRRGTDVVHIRHAISCLSSGGMVTALCYDGAKQQELRPMASHWEPLGPGLFKCEGTDAPVILCQFSR